MTHFMDQKMTASGGGVRAAAARAATGRAAGSGPDATTKASLGASAASSAQTIERVARIGT